MKIVHTLLILSAAANASPAAPLVDVAGRPAVGNIGQRGRPETVVEVATAVALPVVVAPVRAAALPVVALTTLARGVQAMSASLSPLVNSEGRPAAGNTMGKRSRR